MGTSVTMKADSIKLMIHFHGHSVSKNWLYKEASVGSQSHPPAMRVLVLALAVALAGKSLLYNNLF